MWLTKKHWEKRWHIIDLDQPAAIAATAACGEEPDHTWTMWMAYPPAPTLPVEVCPRCKACADSAHDVSCHQG